MFTYSSWSSRSWLIVRGAQPAIQQQIGLDALKRLYEAKGFNYVMSGDELHQNEHVESLSAFGLGVASSLVHLLVIVCMFVVGSDSVVVCFLVFSSPWHGGLCGEQPAASGWDGSDHQSGYLGPVPELHQRQ